MRITAKGTANSSAGTTRRPAGQLIIAGGSSPTGRLDLNNNALIVDEGSLSLVTAQIKSGLENGWSFDWRGNGISSSKAAQQNATAGSFLYALGVLWNTDAQFGGPGDPFYTSFAGETVSGNEVLVKFTYFGDADLTGVIDATDYSLIDNGYVNSLTGWINGDFDYSGVIDATDYALIDNAYINQGGPMAESTVAYHSRMFGTEYTVALRAIQAGVIPEPTRVPTAISVAAACAWYLGRHGRSTSVRASLPRR